MKSADVLPILESSERSRGVGLLEALQGLDKVQLPLSAVRMTARVAERVARVTVTQTFRNPYPDALECVYIFPLPGGSAVSDFELRVGKRVVKGAVKERQEARAAYQQALQQGNRAALMEQERDDVFTVSVGNIPPGEDVTVVIETSERLPYFDDGMTELRLPVVVAPRYVAGQPVDGEPTGDGVESDTDAVPDASRITPPRLAEGFDPKVALGIEVELMTSGEELRDVACTQHAIRTSLGADKVGVRLSSEQEPLNRDFVLRWRVASAALRTSCLAWKDDKGRRFAMLNVVPPRRDGFLGLARDVVFVVDRSGSMEGVKLASAARSCSMLLNTLGPRDRFAICAFDTTTLWMSKGTFTWADDAGLAKGDTFLRGIQIDGGTELGPALDEALSAFSSRRETAGRAPVVVILTDGEVGDEAGILRILQQKLGDARAFTVGIDTAVNSGFLKRLAALGGGTASFVTPGGDLEDALRAVGREIGRPLVTDLALDKGPEELAPSRVPDLFAGRASTVFFLAGDASTVRVRGRLAGGGTFDETVPVRDINQPAVASLWARARVADLEDQFRLRPEMQADLKSQIVRIAVEHTLLTRFTAFVAVDRSEVVKAAQKGRKVVQPVENPAKWDMLKDRTQKCEAKVTEDMIIGDSDLACRSLECEKIMDGADTTGLNTAPLQFDASAEGAQPETKPEPAKKRNFLGGVFHPKQPAPPPAPAPRAMASAPANFVASGRGRGAPSTPPVSESDRAEFSSALETFAKALAVARNEARAGRVPDPALLEEARAALVKTLASSPLAADVPLLQRFLRLSAVEIVAACGTLGASAAALHEMLEHLAKTFEAALQEADSAMAKEKGRRWWAFWEKSV